MDYRKQRLSLDVIHCDISQKADIRFQDGALPHARGACCYQVIRAAKDAALSPGGSGHTYNHAAMLAFFGGHFLYAYLSGPRNEHEAPSIVWLAASADGIHWQPPREAFPAISVDAAPYRGPKKECVTGDTLDCIVHQRMAFYTARNGRLLLMTFYGISPDFHMAPNNGYGVGRAVREVYPDLTLSDIYFLRYNEPGGYCRENVRNFPFYEESGDAGFREACCELLSNNLVKAQWWEEERLAADLAHCPPARALSYYTLPSGRVMGLFKESYTAYTDDGGASWSELTQSASIETSSGKVWGQRTPDGRYALAYNPSPDGAHRWPLAIVSGDDGIHFGELSAIVPEISPCRYEGALKNLGAQYVRGIAECNARPDDPALWLSYSVNKEDMWISRVPVPLSNAEAGDVHDEMSRMTDRELRDTWNLYVPAWNSAELVQPAPECRALRLTDADPYDRTRAMRLFAPGARVAVTLSLAVQALLVNRVAIQLQDRSGQAVCNVVFDPDGGVYLRIGGMDRPLRPYAVGETITLDILCDCVENRVEIVANSKSGKSMLRASTAASAMAVERVLIATKYALPWQGLEANGKRGEISNLPGADIAHAPTVLDIVALHVRAG